MPIHGLVPEGAVLVEAEKEALRLQVLSKTVRRQTLRLQLVVLRLQLLLPPPPPLLLQRCRVWWLYHQ